MPIDDSRALLVIGGSGASGRPTLPLHLTWRHNARKVVGLLPGLQEALAPFSARPHWESLAAIEPQAQGAKQGPPLTERRPWRAPGASQKS